MDGPPRGFRVRVVSSRPLTPTTHAIEVEKPKDFTFGPTQFTFLQLPTEEGMDARPMSLATSPTRPHLEYAVRLSDSPYKRAFVALPIRLVYSNRSEDEIVYRKEFDALEKQNDRFRVLYTLTRAEDSGWPGLTGRIDEGLLRDAAGGLAHPIYYVSGTPSMVVGTLRLLRSLGIPDDDIEVEAFRGYA